MPKHRLKVWVWNGEDPADEIVRRLKAICLYYGRRDDITETPDGDEPLPPRFDFTFEDLKGYLYLDSGRDTPIKIATLNRQGHNIEVAKPVVREMIRAIDGEGIDVVGIDPFINAHSVPENDAAIDAVVGAFKDIAYQTGVAIEHVHHTRKPRGHDNEVTSDDSRGSTAILAAWRDSRVINIMSADEAMEQGVSNRLRFIKLESDRPNMTVRGEGVKWFYLESVNIENATDDYPKGDDVGIVVPWSPPTKTVDEKATDAVRILDAVLELLDDGKRITKERGGDYSVKQLVGYLKRQKGIVAKVAEIQGVLLAASEGADAKLEYSEDSHSKKPSYRRARRARASSEERGLPRP